MWKFLSVAALFGGTLGFIAIGLHFGNRYIDRMLGPPRT